MFEMDFQMGYCTRRKLFTIENSIACPNNEIWIIFILEHVLKSWSRFFQKRSRRCGTVIRFEEVGVVPRLIRL